MLKGQVGEVQGFVAEYQQIEEARRKTESDTWASMRRRISMRRWRRQAKAGRAGRIGRGNVVSGQRRHQEEGIRQGERSPFQNKEFS